MKNVYFLFIMLFLAAFLSGQASIFDLSFGATREESIATLEEQGFRISLDYGYSLYLVPIEGDTLNSVEVDLMFLDTEDILSDWLIRFPVRDNPDLEANLWQALTDLHGPGSTTDDANQEHREGTWILGGKHILTAKYDSGTGFLWLNYETERDFSNDEDDEDEYWGF